jgi:hypothetical protein
MISSTHQTVRCFISTTLRQNKEVLNQNELVTANYWAIVNPFKIKLMPSNNSAHALLNRQHQKSVSDMKNIPISRRSVSYLSLIIQPPAEQPLSLHRIILTDSLCGNQRAGMIASSSDVSGIELLPRQPCNQTKSRLRKWGGQC